MKARIAIVLLVMISFLSGCPEGGIYYTLEKETPTTDNTLKNGIPIHGVAKLVPAYYVAAGSVWKGTLTPAPVAWDTSTPITPPVDGALCTALVAFDPGPGLDLYGGFITQSGNVGLYKAGGPSPTTFVGGQITDPLVVDKQVALLDVLNGGAELVISTVSPGDPFSYGLVLFDGTTYSTLFPDTATKPFTGVAFTSTPGTYWAVSGTSLYSGAAGALVVEPRLTKSATEEVLTSVFSDNGTRLFVTSNLGYVYYSADEGATWTPNASAKKVSDTVVSFLTVAGGPNQSKMLVGSDGYGYYVLDTAVTPPTLERFADSTIGLYTASISRFLIDENRLFACTLKGLWRTESFDATDCSVESWIQE